MRKKQRIRAVLDTNLFVSGLFASHGTMANLKQLWVTGVFELAVSEEILQEIAATLQKPSIQKELFLKPEEIGEIVNLIRERAFIVTKDPTKPTGSRLIPMITSSLLAPWRHRRILWSPATTTFSP